MEIATSLTLFFRPQLFRRFLRKTARLGPTASVLVDSKSVAPGTALSQATLQVSESESARCGPCSARRSHARPSLFRWARRQTLDSGHLFVLGPFWTKPGSKVAS